MTMFRNAGGDIPLLLAEDVFCGNKDFYIHLSTDYTEYESKLHMHEFVEISHIVSGEAEHEINGIKYRVHRGDIVAIRRGVPHTFRPADCGEPFVAYDVMFTENFLSSDESSDIFIMCKDLFSANEKSGDLRISGGGYQLLGELFHKIYSEFRTRSSGYLDLIRSYVTELVVNIFRRLEDSGAGRMSLRLKGAVRSTVAYLEENFRRNISLEELAQRIFFSKDYLNKVFKEITGTPIGVYLQKIRIAEAKRLLLDTDMTVSDIAERSGFRDMKSFYNVFKREIGMIPKEFRERYG